MTYGGARGYTEKQIAQVLHFPWKNQDLHKVFSELESHLNDMGQSESVELSIANGLWAQRDYPFLQEFLDLVENSYRAKLSHADFQTAHEAVREEINLWVENQTNDKIKDLLKPGVIGALTRLVLVNAIYFKGLWASPFEEAATRDDTFWTAPDVKVDVPLMTQEDEFGYMEDDQIQVLELPYTGDDLSLVVLLPKTVDGFSDLEDTLSVDGLDTWLGQLMKGKVQVFLPRFKIAASLSLAETLASMGMPDAFRTPEADFSGMDGTRSLFISAIVHQAFVDVNEEGTEAAAATAAVVGLTAMPAPSPVFRADHPFLFLIRENRSGSILFLGRVVDPTK
jgi:serpin B